MTPDQIAVITANAYNTYDAELSQNQFNDVPDDFDSALGTFLDYATLDAMEQFFYNNDNWINFAANSDFPENVTEKELSDAIYETIQRGNSFYPDTSSLYGPTIAILNANHR